MSTLQPHQVLDRELDLIRARRAGVNPPPREAADKDGEHPPQTPDTHQDRSKEAVLADAHRLASFGIAFSGGGIRSATFNLGVLQGLSERHLLTYVDMLSTVSGGGYIGSWLHALIRNHGDGHPGAIERQLQASLRKPEGTPTADAIGFLRSYSNYLAPRPGLFSGDTWTMVMIWVRNVLLNHLILAPAFATLVAAALTALFLHEEAPAGAALVQAVVALVALIAASILLVRNLLPIARKSTENPGAGTRDHTSPADGSTASGAIASGRPVKASVDDGRLEGFFIVLFVLVSAVALGTSALLRVPEAWRVVLVATFLMMVLLQCGGGFYGCYKARHDHTSLALVHIVWMSVVCCSFATLCFVGVGRIAASWQGEPWRVFIFAPALLLAGILLSMMLLIGLMGADYPDAAREWTARIGSHLAIAAVAWTVLLTLAVLGPWAFARVISGFRTLGITALLAWLATTAGGALAGSSGTTNRLEGGTAKKALEWLTHIAPTVFLIGYVVFVAIGVHKAFDLLLPPPSTRAAPAQPSRQYDVAVRTPESSTVEVRVEGTEPGWLASALAPVDAFERGYPARLLDPGGERLPAAAILLGVFAAIALVASARININEFSLHHFYKNRLVRCYMGASNRSRRPNSLTGFDPRDDFPLASLTPRMTGAGGQHNPYLGPYPIINTAVNINTGAELAQQERKAASFVFTPAVCGFDPALTGEQVKTDDGDPSPFGYRDTLNYAYPAGPNLGTTFAISGAAANPNWGYHTSGPVAFLLTVFNARLGWWVGNPRWSKASTRDGPRASLWYLFAELLGLTSKRSRFVNLSDGGHFENLGLYELIRRRTRFIIVCDAEQDGDLHFGSLGGAVRKCRADFGVEIDIDPAPITLGTGGRSGAHCVIGSITYPEDESAFGAGLTGGLKNLEEWKKLKHETPRARGWLLYLKSSLTGDEPADVTEYHASHHEFPHESTGDQFFAESQFESYRRLGLHVVRSAFDGVPKAQAMTGDSQADTVTLIETFQALSRRWYAPIPVSAEAATRLADAYVVTMRRLASDPELEPLYRELVTSSPTQSVKATPAMMAFGMELFQLMQNVFTEFKLEGDFNQANPRNSGWIDVFNKWLQSDLLYHHIWPGLSNDYHAIFRQFVDTLHDKGVPDVPPRP